VEEQPSLLESMGLKPDYSFWQDKNVILTGHTGFKGSWLTIWLSQLGAKVTGYALDPLTDPNLFSALDFYKSIIDHRGDIRDLSTLERVIRSNELEIIIHMAAQSLVRESYKDPVGTYATNVMGTVNLMEAARSCDNVRVILVVTSDKCYENKEIDYGYRETDPMGGHDPYSSSKGCVELMTAAYRRSFFEDNPKVAIASARAGNVIGGGDWAADRIIPDAMRAFSENRTLKVRFPNAIRPWQHVLEPLSGYMTLCENMWKHPSKFSEGWNFGPEDESVRTVEEVTERVSDLWGNNASWEKSNGDHPHEATLLKLDITKAKEQLGWAPKWDLDMALEKTVTWYKNYYNDENMLEVTLRQIKKYQES
jgi:CDP-glucose 4,6-dehydratase